MFNIGFGEMLLLGVIALVFIGPEQLPQLARTLGRLLNEWKRATSDLQSTFTTTFTEDINRHLQGNPHSPQHQNTYEQNQKPPEATQAQNAAAPNAASPNPAPSSADATSAEPAQSAAPSAPTDKKENNS